MRLTIHGALLFLFIPLVLFLYLRQPFGPAVSVVVGLIIMFGHRLVAAPWMERHARERCLWCGRRLHVEHGVRENGSAVATGDFRSITARDRVPAIVSRDVDPAIHVLSGRTERVMAACRGSHRDHGARFLAFVARYRAPIAAGIFVPLLVLLGGSLADAWGRPLLSHEWNTWQFRTIVALTVIVVSFAYRSSAAPPGPVRSPFPLHNFFLLGIRNTLWVFRIVGAWWLAIGVLYLAAR